MIYALFVHFVADFVCQSDAMALNKSKSWYWLSMHIATYTAVLALGLGLWLGLLGLTIAVVNGAAHFSIDAGTSRASSYLWQRGQRHWFWCVIGLDQWMHAALLVWTLRVIARA